MPFLPILLLLLSVTARAADRAAVERFCPPPLPAIRAGSGACWARYDLPGAVRLCFRRELWAAWLAGSEGLCGTWKGRWRSLALPGRPRGEGAVRAFYAESRVTAEPDGPRWRGLERARERLAALLEPGDRLGVLRKLMVNQTGGGGAIELLRLLGYVHLVTAAGIHLYALARLSEAAARLGLARAGVPVTAALAIARAFSMVLWAALWLLEGMRPGMLRPFVIVVLRSAARAAGFGWRRYFPLLFSLALDGAAALALAWSDPRSAWSPGRLHYALAVGGGLMALDALERARGSAPRPGALREHAALSIGSWLPTAVLDVATAGVIASATPVLSLVSIPVFTLFVLPAALALLVLEPLDPALARAAALHLGEAVSLATEAGARFAMATGSLLVAGAPSLAAGAVLAGVRMVLSPGPRATAAMAAALAVIAAVRVAHGPAPAAHPRAARVVQLDVGQGDAALVVLDDGRAMLLDTGSGAARRPSDWILAFAAHGVTRLEAVGLTHLDEDHSGALPLLLALLPVGRVALTAAQASEPRGQALSVELARLGVPRAHPWELPVPGVSVEAGTGGNRFMNAWAVPLAGGGWYLNTGDAELRGEVEIARRLRLPSGAPRILKAGHHGSRTSNGQALLRAFGPDEVWISAGAGNPHGHPSREVLERFKALGSRIRRTDLEGNLEWRH